LNGFEFRLNGYWTKRALLGFIRPIGNPYYSTGTRFAVSAWVLGAPLPVQSQSGLDPNAILALSSKASCLHPNLPQPLENGQFIERQRKWKCKRIRNRSGPERKWHCQRIRISRGPATHAKQKRNEPEPGPRRKGKPPQKKPRPANENGPNSPFNLFNLSSETQPPSPPVPPPQPLNFFSSNAVN